MKRKISIFIFLIISIMVCSNYYVRHQNMEVISTQNLTSQNSKILEVNIVLNTWIYPNCEKNAEEIIQHCIENDFDGVMLSYDKGYPNELVGRVYLTKGNLKRGKYYYEFSYKPEESADQCTYNIVENREKYLLVIKKQ